jgi:hypothetical protein
MEHGYRRLVPGSAQALNMHTLRLLVLTKHLLDPRDAQAQQSAALINALSSTGVCVDVITGDVALGTPRIPLDPSVHLYSLPARWLTHRQNVAAKVIRKLERNLTAWLATAWATDASHLASRLMADRTYDAIMSIALPMESHIAAKLAHRKAPWIAATSDPWPESILPKPYCDFAIPVLNALQKAVVRDVFATADALIVPCSEGLGYLAKHYPTLDRGKAFLVPHVAPANFPELSSAETDTLTLVHGGALSRERVCPGLAEALSALPPSSRWRLRFVGQIHPDMLRLFERAGAMQRVLVDGWKSKPEALEILASAQALLLVEACMTAYPFLPSKLADYTVTGHPILAITGEGSAAARLIREYSAGIVAGHSSHSILQALLSMEGRLASLSSRNLGTTFQAQNIASKFHEIIDSLNTRTISRDASPPP